MTRGRRSLGPSTRTKSWRSVHDEDEVVRLVWLFVIVVVAVTPDAGKRMKSRTSEELQPLISDMESQW